MVAQALYLKYRPLDFDELVGQEPITRTLKNALRQGRMRHAYLLSGPRGTGKTTTARILAKALNCLAPEDKRPCNECRLCVALNEGRLMDLVEIDAASNRGIDEIRDIREKVRFRPNEGRFRIYVLDEAHMLTDQAFNALLKTLEEPPPHVVFVLVTTEPHKIPATIASRCQRFDFRRIPHQAVMERLAYIAGEEGIQIESAAVELIARQSTGAMRDAISLLDQLTSYGQTISLEQVQMVVGYVAGAAARDLVKSLAARDLNGGLDQINRAVEAGTDPRQLGQEVIEFLRALLLLQQGAGASNLSLTSEQAAEMEALARRFSLERLMAAIKAFSAASTDLKRKLQTIPQLPLEMALVGCLLVPSEPESGVEMRRDLEQNPATAPEGTGPVTSRPAIPEPSTPEPSAREPQHPPHAPVASITISAESADPSRQPGSLSLEDIEGAWDSFLQAVRRRNPTAEGALRTGCKPVEVVGSEIVVTFPYPFLRDKLGAPQRKAEIQDALTEVLNLECRLTLTLASEYKPSQAAQSGANREQEPAEELEPSELEQITRWAQERGGHTSMIGPTDIDDGSQVPGLGHRS